MKTPILMAGLCLALAACATTGRLSSAEKLDLYRAHAGAPQNDMQFFGSLKGWTELGDKALAVWTRPSEAWLLELVGPCMDLSYAPTISVTNMMGKVSAKFDRVIVHGGMSTVAPMPCRIDSIRPLAVKALRASEKELRQAKLEARSEEAVPHGD